MRGIFTRPVLLFAGLAMVLASCGGDAPAVSTTTAPADTSTTAATLPPETTTTTLPTTTTTTVPSGPPLAAQGDRNQTVAAIQFLLNCNGFGPLTVDGSFGPKTLAAVQDAQRRLGREADGAPDEETVAELSRSCDEPRPLEGDAKTTVVGNAAPDDPEVFVIALLSNSTVKAAITEGLGFVVRVTAGDGSEVDPLAPGTWQVDSAGDYLIEVGSPEGPAMFSLAVEVAAGQREKGDWILATDGLIYKGTKLALGADAPTVITKVTQYLGHGVRSGYGEFDTGWYVITDPGDMGLRGIFIEGFALLFYGPDPSNPTRPETFARHRFEGPGTDAAGNPRPRNYATTATGITVGDTLADLKAAYGSRVTPGHNSKEHYYRLRDSAGVLCFYFDTPGAPTDYSPIVEIASQCRTG